MLSTLDLVNIGVGVTVVCSYAYVAYSTTAIRRTLAVGLYRRQALGIELIAIGFTAIYLAGFLPYTGILGFIGGGVFDTVALFLLYWVDSSILAARRSDPLVRDTLKWSGLRRIVWVVAVSDIAVTYGLAWYLSFGPDYGLLFSIIFPLPIYLAAFSGAIVVPIAARRTRDLTLRKNLEWFFVFIVIQLGLQGGVSQLFASDVASAGLVNGVALMIGFYPLYQSGKRLVPLYRFSAEDTAAGVASPQDPTNAPSTVVPV